MIFTYSYIVTTHRDGVFDQGSWTGHNTKKEAQRCAKDVGGYAYKVIEKPDGSVKVKPVKVDRS